MDPVDFGWTPGDPDVKTCLKVSLLSLTFWFSPVRPKPSQLNRYLRNKYAIFVKQYGKKESSFAILVNCDFKMQSLRLTNSRLKGLVTLDIFSGNVRGLP